MPNPAHARILFVDDVFENNSETYEIGANDDASATDLTLQFGGTSGETVQWNSTDGEFEISDDIQVGGNISANGTIFTLDVDNAGSGANIDIVAEQGSDNNGILRYDATANAWQISNDGGAFVGIAGNLDNAYNHFGAAASTITVDAAESQTGGIQFVGSLAGDETVSITNSGDGGGLFVENTGAGTSFRVDDVASDTTPFVVDASGNVAVGTATPSSLLHVTAATAGDAIITVEADTDNNDEADNPSILFLQDGGSQTGTLGIGGDADVAFTGALSNAFYLHANDTGGTTEYVQLATATVARVTIDEVGEVGIGTNAPANLLDVEGNGQVLELGDATANDVIINFDDATDRQLGWDDNYSGTHTDGTFSTYDQEFAFRTIQSATPPVTCSATVAGMQWMDTDTGILYICDTSNSRNKWLSVEENVIFGDESGSCGSGASPNSDTDCNVDWGNGLGPDAATDLGFYIPRDITITGYGFSEDNDACTSGSFDLEVWGTGSNSDDNNYVDPAVAASGESADVVTGLDNQAHGAGNLNVDLAGDQFTLWGIDNNCGQAIDDWNMVVYFKWRHD